MILYNGIVYSNNTFYTAVVIDREKIVYIGNDRDALNYSEHLKDNERINLNGRLVLPGFIDSHAHGGMCHALAKNKIDLTNENNIEVYLATIEKFVKENPDSDFYKGTGWSSPVFGKKGPVKELLDRICSNKPIVIRAIEGHSLWANSKAIEMAGVTESTENPKGGVISRNEDGTLRGTFFDTAQKFIEDITPDDAVGIYKEAILDYQQMMIPYGYTASTEMMMEKGSNLHKAYQQLAAEGKLLIKASLSHWIRPETVPESVERMGKTRRVFENKLIDGYYAKIFLDGVLEGATAWLKEPYDNAPDFYGEPLWDDESLFRTCASLDNLGYDIHFHVIGDRAVAQMIDAVEYVTKTNGPKERRTVAAHVQLMDKKDIPRMASSGISVSANPYWFFKDEIYTQLNEIPMLGKRVEQQFPMKSLVDQGIVISAGSDYIITEDPNPIQAIKFGMERVAQESTADDMNTALNIAERVTFDDMLKCVTINGAYTLNIEDMTGSIETGKCADLVVLDRNLFNAKTTAYKDIKIDMTISEGEIVYRRN